jgi:hypothetical protein
MALSKKVVNSLLASVAGRSLWEFHAVSSRAKHRQEDRFLVPRGSLLKICGETESRTLSNSGALLGA